MEYMEVHITPGSQASRQKNYVFGLGASRAGLPDCFFSLEWRHGQEK